MTDEKKPLRAIDGILRLRSAFVSAGLDPPSAVYLATHKDGRRLLGEVERCEFMRMGAPEHCYERPVELADGSVAMEIDVAGIKVRWPADLRMRHDGAWRYE